MNLPPKIRFKIINNLKLDEVKKSNYVIYAHTCSEGIYVGMSSDPVRRLQEHYIDAFNKDSHHYDEKFKAAIRKYGNKFTHYIVGIASSEEAARKKEAAAIEFYSDRLNTLVEINDSARDYGFRPINSQIGVSVVLEKKGSQGAWHPRDDSHRKTVTAEIYMEEGRKRLRTIDGQVFAKGLRIECSKSERERFNVGDKVRINVALSDKSGTPYLVSAKTAKFVLVK